MSASIVAMRSVSRAIACAASAAERELTSSCRFGASRALSTTTVALGGGPDQNFKPLADEASVRRVSAASLRRSRSALSAPSPRRPGNPDRADLHDARAERDRRGPVRNRQRPPVELGAEGEGDVGLVERRVGGLRLGDDAIESGGIASRQRRAAEVHRPGAGEALDQRRGTAPGRGEIDALLRGGPRIPAVRPRSSRRSATRSASPCRRRDGASPGRRRRLARSAS